MQKDNDGRSVMKKIYKYHGDNIRSREDAVKLTGEVWEKSLKFRIESVDGMRKERCGLNAVQR